MNSKINVNNQLSIERLAQQWIEKFNAAIEKQDVRELGDIFIEDCHWRDLLALTWRIETHSGRETLQEKIIISSKIHGMKNFQLDKRRSAPKLVERAGQICIEAFGCFDTNIGKCVSVFRLSTDGNSAWTFMSALEEVFDSKKDESDDIPDVGTDISAPNWLDGGT
jgi:hypothetical protein